MPLASPVWLDADFAFDNGFRVVQFTPPADDENWPEWYASYLVAERAGQPLPE
ncbi:MULTISPECIES: hypothetical protein [unclassified Kribbella]|uniref:hypothetical protein n=1 Tax=unclassified Kribbella TaxID=2644121 RepID=UPI00301B650C